MLEDKHWNLCKKYGEEVEENQHKPEAGGDAEWSCQDTVGLHDTMWQDDRTQEAPAGGRTTKTQTVKLSW